MKSIFSFFTDLDGTLLDESTYSFDAAKPALALIRSLGICLVICTSKTRAEVLPLQRKLGIESPFIVENGGAIHLPSRIFAKTLLHHDDDHEWIQVELGTPYERMVEFLAGARKQLDLEIVGFSDLSVSEIAARCGLPLEQARRAKEREYDEPFFILRSAADSIQAFESAAAEEGLAITRGGRCCHLAGGCDKGRAVNMLARIMRFCFGDVFTMGIGDSPNDLSMLEAVDLPILVQRPGGRYHPVLVNALEKAIRAPGIGPIGWNEAVVTLLKEKVE